MEPAKLSALFCNAQSMVATLSGLKGLLKGSGLLLVGLERATEAQRLYKSMPYQEVAAPLPMPKGSGLCAG